MIATVIGVTKDVDTFDDSNIVNLETYAGKNAGICYMKDKYFGSSVSDDAKALKRFSKVVGTGHHSIADHTKIEVLLEGVSKMLAIVLNSIQNYDTCEKSGRYTEFSGLSQEESDLYAKWFNIFKDEIENKYPDLDEYTRTNLAKENARLTLSVFTRGTTMGYTTSLRQWNYIYDWCLKYMSRFRNENNCLYDIKNEKPASKFEEELYKDFSDLSDFIKENLYIEELRDIKGGCFDLLTSMASPKEHPMSKYSIVERDICSSIQSKDDVLGITYSVSYPASLIHLAQAERHRTLKYFMQFNPSRISFYIPDLIRGTYLEDEWLRDLNEIKDSVPQATLVGVIETGHVANFVLKCKERLCGRAQLEITQQTYKTLKRFIDVRKSSDVLSAYLEEVAPAYKGVLLKCDMLGGCKEPCRWKSKNEVLTRKI